MSDNQNQKKMSDGAVKKLLINVTKPKWHERNGYYEIFCDRCRCIDNIILLCDNHSHKFAAESFLKRGWRYGMKYIYCGRCAAIKLKNSAVS